MGGSGGGQDDDPWDGVVFDEAFVKGGRHEPPARTRESIARYGGERTSWRQGALLQPAPPRRPRRRRRVWGILVAMVAVAALAWLLITKPWSPPSIPATAPTPTTPAAGPTISASTTEPVTSSTTGSTPPEAVAPGSAASSPSAGPSETPTVDTTTEVVGVSTDDAVGTCYLDPLAGDATAELTAVPCTESHNLELVSHRTAEGQSSTYPDDTYWNDTVGDACQEDLTAYLGTPPSDWPARLSAYWIYPQQESWEFGDRDVTCLFFSDVPVTESELA